MRVQAPVRDTAPKSRFRRIWSGMEGYWLPSAGVQMLHTKWVGSRPATVHPGWTLETVNGLPALHQPTAITSGATSGYLGWSLGPANANPGRRFAFNDDPNAAGGNAAVPHTAFVAFTTNFPANGVRYDGFFAGANASGFNNTISQTSWRFRLRDNLGTNSSFGIAYHLGGGLIDITSGQGISNVGNGLHVIAATMDGTDANNASLYYRRASDGQVLVHTETDNNSLGNQSTTLQIQIGSELANVFYHCALYGQFHLREEEFRALADDPFLWARPEPQLFFVGSSGGSGVTGTAAVTAGPASAAAFGAHGVSGSAAASFVAARTQASGTVGNAVSGTAAARAGAAHSGASGIVVPFGAAAARAPAIRTQAWGLATPPPDYSDIGDAFILEVGVPYSVNSIINGALDLIASNGIASLSDSSSHIGNAIKRNFDVERDSLLREYPWNFAMRRAKLAASSEAPAFRFRRAYELPAGPKPEFCLRVWAVGNEENRQDSDVWEISGRRLLTDLEAPLPIRYIGRIVNPALWDPLTIKALEARLAWQAAYMASGSAALAEQMARIYQERLDAAKAIDAQEGTPEPFEDGTTWVASRLSGASW